MTQDLLTTAANDIMRYGFIVYDNRSTIEDTFDDNVLHNQRFLRVIICKTSYLIRMRDGRAVEIECDYDFPFMVKNSEKIRTAYAEKIREKYGNDAVEAWKKDLAE